MKKSESLILLLNVSRYHKNDFYCDFIFSFNQTNASINQALEEIKKDLQIFEKNENSTDEDLKRSTLMFRDEVISCKNGIEERLNKILFDD